MQNQIAAAQLDYCAHAVCGEAQKQLFRNVGAMVAFDRMGGEHAMFGLTAGDLFSDPKVAALARAACSGDLAEVAAAVGDGADPNAIGGEGSGPGGSSQRVTPLLWAIDCANAEGVEALLSVGADPNQREEFGATPMTVAAATSDPAVLRHLLVHGGDPNANNDRKTALQIAMEMASRMEWTGDIPEGGAWANWDSLLAAGANPDRVAPKGRSLIEVAAMNDDWKVVSWLLERGWAGDPVSLGRTLESDESSRSRPGMMPLPSDTRTYQNQVKAELIRRGVRFPIGPLNDLTQDERGFYVQR